VVPLTARIKLELQLAGNAFVTGRAPLLADVFDFLWRCHPNFRRPDGTMPNRPAGRGSAVLAFLARRWLVRKVRGIDLFDAEWVIRLYLADLEQDAPADEEVVESGRKARLIPPPRAHWVDNLIVSFARQFPMTIDQILDCPLQIVYQLYRAQEIAAGECVIDRSTEAINRWAFAQMDKAAAARRN
jgi:hypothetical protein